MNIWIININCLLHWYSIYKTLSNEIQLTLSWYLLKQFRLKFNKFLIKFYISASTCAMFSSERRLTLLGWVHCWTELSIPWAEGLGTRGSKMDVPASMRRIRFWISLALVSPELVVSNLDSPVAKSFSRQLSPMHRIQTSPCAFIAQHGFMLWGGGKGAVANLPIFKSLPAPIHVVWYRLGF